MGGEKGTSLDILGIKPVGDAANAAVSGLLNFLSKICMPAAEEFGFLLRDQVHAWRFKNSSSIGRQWQENMQARQASENEKVHPRIAAGFIEHGSWVSDEDLQKYWAGLLSSSCDVSPKDTNIHLFEILKNLSSIQVLILNKCCENSIKYKSKSGFALAYPMVLKIDTLEKIAGAGVSRDVIDQQLDLMRFTGLLHDNSGFGQSDQYVTICLSGFALSFYARCQGYKGEVAEFYKFVEGVHEIEMDVINYVFGLGDGSAVSDAMPERVVIL